MTLTVNPPQPASPPVPRPHRRRLVAIVTAAMLAAAGLGAGLATAFGGSSTPPTSPTANTSPAYSYYQSVMGRYGLGPGSMMGGSGYGWMMMGSTGYGWMMGGTAAPGWMTGGSLPGFMTGSATDPGEVIGSLFADAPGPRASAAEANTLANKVPGGAVVDPAAKRITFTGSSVTFAAVASPAGADDRFEVAGIVDPTIVIPTGARVSIQLVNADTTSAHGLVVTAAGAASAWMPMMTSPAAFDGGATWFLGNATSAGDHTATVTFSASTAGSYRYLCPVPGHAQKGMVGTFVVQAS